jgi:hypothetical protein
VPRTTSEVAVERQGGGLGLNLREPVGAWIEVAGGVVVAGLVGDAARDAADDASEDREEVGAGGRGTARGYFRS